MIDVVISLWSAVFKTTCDNVCRTVWNQG